MMKKGINRWAFPADMSLVEVFALAKCSGFDGVEVTMDLNGELSPDTTDEEALAIKTAAESSGISLYSLAASVYWSVSLVADDPAERNKAKEYVKKQLHLAKILGCKTILAIPGHTGVDFAPNLGIIDYSVAYERAVGSAKDLAPYAENDGIVLNTGGRNFRVKILDENRNLEEISCSVENDRLHIPAVPGKAALWLVEEN